MKPETVFALENANWPALLVDAAGNVRAFSQGAKSTFGQVLEARPALGQSIWSKENEQTPEEFFACFDDLDEKDYQLRFKGRDGSTSSYNAHIN